MVLAIDLAMSRIRLVQERTNRNDVSSDHHLVYETACDEHTLVVQNSWTTKMNVLDACMEVKD